MAISSKKVSPEAVTRFMLMIAARTSEANIRCGILPLKMIGVEIGVDEQKVDSPMTPSPFVLSANHSDYFGSYLASTKSEE
ncbi:hypothetical protein RB195_023943 [Necator americanus]|uniref:Uncharacterized protein n=1 Tax=Necator americanus TaxID=51031 RepID=A0ABR1EL70_NECAM